jgi:hypothetical protein
MPEGVTPPEAEVAESKYANYFKVGHNAFEFIIDFAQLYSGQLREKVHTRIATSPAYARALLAVIQEAVDAYERDYGAIPKNE